MSVLSWRWQLMIFIGSNQSGQDPESVSDHIHNILFVKEYPVIFLAVFDLP